MFAEVPDSFLIFKGGMLAFQAFAAACPCIEQLAGLATRNSNDTDITRCPGTDSVVRAQRGWRRFRPVVEALPADQSALLWQAQAEAKAAQSGG